MDGLSEAGVDLMAMSNPPSRVASSKSGKLVFAALSAHSSVVSLQSGVVRAMIKCTSGERLQRIAQVFRACSSNQNQNPKLSLSHALFSSTEYYNLIYSRQRRRSQAVLFRFAQRQARITSFHPTHKRTNRSTLRLRSRLGFLQRLCSPLQARTSRSAFRSACRALTTQSCVIRIGKPTAVQHATCQTNNNRLFNASRSVFFAKSNSVPCCSSASGQLATTLSQSSSTSILNTVQTENSPVTVLSV